MLKFGLNTSNVLLGATRDPNRSSPYAKTIVVLSSNDGLDIISLTPATYPPFVSDTLSQLDWKARTS